MNFLVRSMVSGDYLESAVEAGRERSAWKFVLIETPDALNFVCGPISEYRYHANLVAGFCNRENIGALWERKPDLVEILDTEVRVRGGGHIQLDLLARKMKIHGRSTAYGPYNPDHLVELADSTKFFDDYELLVVGL
jgi:hypothetical protein